MSDNSLRNKLLSRQIKKFLGEDLLEIPEIQKFINSVNDSYNSYERDKELMNHAFVLSEREFVEVNEHLNSEYELKKLSIEKLKQALKELDPNFEIRIEEDDELYGISNYLNIQVKKRVELETNLSNTLSLLTTLLSNLNSGIVVEDGVRRLLYVNDSFCRIFNLNTAPDLLKGSDCSSMAMSCAEYFVDENNFVANIESIINKKQRVIKESLRLRDGRTVERDFVPIMIGDEYIGSLWSYTDITDQIKAQEALMKSEEQYRNIIERSSDVIYRTDSKGYFTFVNKVAEKVTGYANSELLSMHFGRLIKESSRKEVMKFYRDQVVNRLRSSYLEFPIITKNGGEKWIGQTVQLSEISTYGYEFTAFAVDITERRNFERKIILQEEKYRNIITNMHLGLMEVDNDDKIKFVNHGFCKISGYSEHELIGKKAAETMALNDAKDVIKRKSKQRQKGISDMYEIPVKNKNGEIRWWLVSGGPNYNDEGELIGSIGIHLDITEKKVLEQELEIQRKKAEDSSKAKESFLANMSHEIRTPLNGIIGMIRELSLEELNDRQIKYVQNASVASQHLLSVLNNILDISKIDAGELKLESIPFNLRETIKEVKSIMSVKAREKGLFFGINVRDIRNNYYLGDSARLRQILLNLIGNSIKFTTKGGVFVECMILETTNKSQKVLINIEDTGIGMEQKYLDNLFNKFTQEDLSTSRKYGGTGLGMAITHELIQLMNGSIKVKSIKNEGTIIEIILDLPFADKAKGALENAKNTLDDIANTSILLVEDNEFNRAVAFNTLKRNKCNVIEAKDGAEAIKIVEEGLHKFDVILMDLQMPIVDGLTASKYMLDELKIDIPIIALSANAFKSEIDRCLSIGIVDYITKPFDEKSLISTIAKYRKVDNTNGETQAVTNLSQKALSAEPYNLQKLIDISGGDMDFVKRMVDIFIVEAQDSIKVIKHAVENKDLEVIYKVSHKMKPMIDSLGITGLSQEIRELEKLSKSGLFSAYIEQMVKTIDETITDVIESMKSKNEI